jgi:hypothetical protein
MCRRGPIQLYLGHEVRTTKVSKRILLQLGNMGLMGWMEENK